MTPDERLRQLAEAAADLRAARGGTPPLYSQRKAAAELIDAGWRKVGLRPMAEAHRDGRPVLLHCPGLAARREVEGHERSADFVVGWWVEPGHWESAVTEVDHGWIDEPGVTIAAAALEPEGWMDLPPEDAPAVTPAPAAAPADIDLHAAIAEFRAALPGWWFTLGTCSVSRDASCGPDRAGPDAALLEQPLFDDGFHADLRGDATMADALRDVMRQALEAKAAHPQREEAADA